ncbi:TolC family protein [Chlorobium phaeovibrioides]|uniref:TolC family protein n=1 Tax=Chlorobium phaeovibrioides TaxID=1094 RepID=A0A3S0NBS8_CHLPH|nr:TolC family protein [Chlorobium phaeovibrioides]RTY39979.1 TolC family protein [Chlorobium phaeovibrioides]
MTITRQGSRLRIVVITAIITVIATHPASSVAVEVLTLDATVRQALAHAGNLRVVRQDQKIADAAMADASMAFSPSLAISAGYARTSIPLDTLGSNSIGGYRSTNWTSSLSLSRLFPQGVKTSASIGLNRIDDTYNYPALVNQGVVSLTIDVPLFEGLGFNETRAELAASKKLSESAWMDMFYQASLTTYQATRAFWTYYYACRRHEADIEQRKLAQNVLEAAAALASTAEISQSKVDQSKAYLKKLDAQMLVSKIVIDDAKATLEQVTGVRMSDTIDARVSAADSTLIFSLKDSLGESDLTRALAVGRSRYDLRALDAAAEAALYRLRGARNRKKPRLDVSVNLGYTTLNEGAAGNDYLAAIGRTSPGMNIGAQLTYYFMEGQTGDQANYARRLAERDRYAIQLEDQKNTVNSSVSAALSRVSHAIGIVRSQRQRRDLYRKLRDIEYRKFRLGLSSLFDLQDISDSFSDAVSDQIDSELSLVTAIVDVRFTTGTILDEDPATNEPVLEAERLITLPL